MVSGHFIWPSSDDSAEINPAPSFTSLPNCFPVHSLLSVFFISSVASKWLIGSILSALVRSVVHSFSCLYLIIISSREPFIIFQSLLLNIVTLNPDVPCDYTYCALLIKTDGAACSLRDSILSHVVISPFYYFKKLLILHMNVSC